MTPILAAVDSWNDLIEKGKVGYFLFTSVKNDLALFDFRLY